MSAHWLELAGLGLLALLVFGPKRLPDMGASIGKTIREFQKSMREVTDSVDTSSLTTNSQTPAQSALPPAQPAQVAQPEQPAQPVSAAAETRPEG